MIHISVTTANFLFLLCGLAAGTVAGAIGVIYYGRRSSQRKGSEAATPQQDTSSASATFTAATTSRATESVVESSAVRPASPPAELPAPLWIRFYASLARGLGYEGPAWGLVLLSGVVFLCSVVASAFLYYRYLRPEVASTPIVVSPTITVTVLQDTMSRKFGGEAYEGEPHANDEVVVGLVGSYYTINFRNATSHKSLFFEPEQYTRDEFASGFKVAMSEFRGDILRHIERKRIPYRLFVRGSADNTGNDAPSLGLLIGGQATQVEYLPMVEDNPNQYQASTATQLIPARFANVHLPNRRAAYVQEKLRVLGFKASVLEGVVARTAGEGERRATMFLFVDWPQSPVQVGEPRTSR